jgi:hypothetical protein
MINTTLWDKFSSLTSLTLVKMQLDGMYFYITHLER